MLLFTTTIVLLSLSQGIHPATITGKETTVSVWVVEGGRADLPCRPDPKLRNDQPKVVLWYRSSNTLPLYSYDAREGDFSSGVRWEDESSVGRRAYYAAESNPPKLVLEPAYAEDEGVYKCRVDYRLSTSTYVFVNLTVVVPPGSPIVLWEGREMVGTVGPLEENEITELTCRSIGGRPSPTLTWWNEGKQIPLLRSNSSVDPVTGTSVVEATMSVTAIRELQGGLLTCSAKTPTDINAPEAATILPRSASIYLNITLSPVEVRILESDSVAVNSGSTISVVCRALGSHPPAELSWWRGSQDLQKHVTYAIEDGGNITTATLSIVVSDVDDGAILSCVGANPAMTHQPLSDTTKLVVFYEPVVKLSLGAPLESRNIKEGDDVYFECSIKANPSVNRIEWFHKTIPISQNVTAGVIMSGKSLVIRNLSRKQTGTYNCFATNPQGRTKSNDFHLIVRHAPICVGSGKERTQGAARGTEVTATCTVESEPTKGITWSWVRKRTDGSEEVLPQTDYVVDGLTSTLTVVPERREDYGRLLCRAINSIGRQKYPCVVNLVPAGPPDVLTNCTAEAINPDDQKPSLSITCLEGFDGGLPQKFLMEAWQEGVLLYNTSSEFPEWTVKGVKPGNAVSFVIVGYNIRGRSDPVKFMVHTSNAQQRASPPAQEGNIEVPPLVGAVLGVVGVLLVLLLVGVAIARKAQSRSKKSSLDKTISASADGFNPDVVQSIHRRPPSLDVLPCLQEEQSKTGNDPILSSSEEQAIPISNRQSPDCLKRLSTDDLNDDGQPLKTNSQVHNQSFNNLHSHRLSFEVNEQRSNFTHTQSDDSGVSESESDSELKIPTSKEQTTGLYREGERGRIYFAVPTDKRSPNLSSSKAMHLKSSPSNSDSEVQISSPSPPELRETAHLIHGVNRRISPTRDQNDTSVSSPIEVICLAVSPTPRTVASAPADLLVCEPHEKKARAVHHLSLESPDFEMCTHSDGDKNKLLKFDKNDLGLPVTLLESGHGDFLLLTRRPSDYEKSGVTMSPSPVYAITTLPKATGKKRKICTGKSPPVAESNPLKKERQMLPPVAPKTKGLDAKHVGRRDYVPPAQPDICRRESSV